MLLGMGSYCQVRVYDHTGGAVPIDIFREHLPCFSDVKGSTLCIFHLVHRVVGFAVSEDGDRIGHG